jgi:hypothetical protein
MQAAFVQPQNERVECYDSTGDLYRELRHLR